MRHHSFILATLLTKSARGSVLAFGVASIVGLWPAGCSSSNSGTNPGTGQYVACQMNSDCNAGLICTLGFLCRPACKTSVDCGTGGSCVTDAMGHAVCRSAVENRTPCDVESMCPAPLGCAADYRCRNACASDADCNTAGISGRECALDMNGAHYCADTQQVNGAGVIDVAPPLLSDGGHLTTLAPSGSGEAGSGPGADAGQDATASAGDAAMSPPSADSGVQSLPALADALMDPTVANAFEAIGASPDAPGVPYSCGTEGVTNGVLTLTKGALCSAQTGVVANYVTLDPNRFLLTGDFDVQVQFDLTMFPLPTTNRWAGFRISSTDPTCWSTENCPGLSIERYDNGALMPVENYKIWDVTSALSSATVTVVGIAPDAGPGGMTGAFRITRQGVNMLAYYQVSGAWVPGHAYAANAGPMAIQFYTGSCSNAGMCASSDEVAESVSFSHLSIALGLQDAGAIADGGSD